MFAFASVNVYGSPIYSNATITSCAGGRHNVTLTFDLLTLKVVSESRVTGLPLCQF